jgi:hypothetical protein
MDDARRAEFEAMMQILQGSVVNCATRFSLMSASDVVTALLLVSADVAVTSIGADKEQFTMAARAAHDGRKLCEQIVGTGSVVREIGRA